MPSNLFQGVRNFKPFDVKTAELKIDWDKFNDEVSGEARLTVWSCFANIREVKILFL